MDPEYFANKLRDFQKAVDYGDQALEMAKQKNDKSKQVHLLNILGETCLRQEEMEKALDYFENGLDLAQRTKGGHPLETESTKKLSELAVKSGDMSKALVYLENGLLSARKNKNKQGEGRWLVQLGDTHQENNENDKSAIYFEDALQLSKKNR